MFAFVAFFLSFEVGILPFAFVTQLVDFCFVETSKFVEMKCLIGTEAL